MRRLARLEGARVAERDAKGTIERSRRGSGLLDMKRAQIDQVHVVSELCKPNGVAPRPASDVKYRRGWIRQVSKKQLLRAFELNPGAAFEQALELDTPCVVFDDRALVHCRPAYAVIRRPSVPEI